LGYPHVELKLPILYRGPLIVTVSPDLADGLSGLIFVYFFFISRQLSAQKTEQGEAPGADEQ
jgi:hypothetical protein